MVQRQSETQSSPGPTEEDDVPTADDDSGPISQGEFKLPRALLHWEAAPPRGLAGRGRSDALETYPMPITRREAFGGSRAPAHAVGEAFDDDPTVAIPVVTYTRDRPDAPQGLLARGAAHLGTALTHAVRLWRDHPLRTAAIVAGVALGAYLAVDGARHRTDRSSQTILSATAAVRAAGPIVVEQLSEARQPGEAVAASQRDRRTDAPGRASVGGRRTREAPFATVAASENGGGRASAPAQSKPSTIELPSTPVARGSAGLPAWGAEAVRDFSGAKSSKASSVMTGSQPLKAKPASSSADIPPPVAAASPPAAREESKPAPAVAAKVAEPPEPVAPARPSTPLTMEQMLTQVEEAAQAQRKKAGLKAPKSSERDAELDALINGAMKKK
jgi:hypothetical protein